MTLSRERPPFVADERTQLVGWLNQQRALVSWKCEGLSEADAYRAVLPASPLMTMAGLVSHLRWVENCWFEVMFLGGKAVGPQFEEPEDSDFMIQGIPIADLVADYERQVAVANEIIAAHPLDAVGRHPDYRSAASTLRWMLLHMIEETARHVGHMDAMRELLDGRRGYF